MSLELYLAYVLACAVITLVPGPTVTVIIANSLAHGPRAGLLNVAGTQLGLALMMAILVVGLSSVILQGFVVLMANPKALLWFGAFRAFLSKKRVRLVSRLSGAFLIGGGIWLALTRGR